MSINFEFADLEAFLAVMETGSFHAAAKRLALSQSAVSRRVQKLETTLDAPLFERTTRRVRPTLAGKRLRARAEAMLEDAEETLRALRDDTVAFAHQRSLVITLAAIPTVIAGLLPPAIASLRASGEEVRLRLLDLAANEVAEAVASGEADLGIGALPALEPNTDFEPLFDDEMVLAVQPGHPLSAHAALSWTDLAPYPLILPAKGTGNRTLIDEAIARARGRLAWTFETVRTTTALSLVAGGAGVAILPRSALTGPGAGAAADSPVLCCPLTDPAIARPIGLLTRNGQARSPVVSALCDALRAAV